MIIFSSLSTTNPILKLAHTLKVFCNHFNSFFFLFYCSKYATIRDNFYKKIEPFILNVTRLPVTDLILELMNSSNFFVNMQLIKFIPPCFDARDKSVT